MEGHEENRNQERGKGPMAPQGQAGRARAQAGRWGGGGDRPCRRGRAGTLILTRDPPPPPPPPSPPNLTPPPGSDPRPSRGLSPHATRPRAVCPPPPLGRPPSLKSSGGSEATRPLPGSGDQGPQPHVRGRWGTFQRRRRSEPQRSKPNTTALPLSRAPAPPCQVC